MNLEIVSKIEEIEFLFYEFKRHILIPKEVKNTASNFTPSINLERFAKMMPPSFNPSAHEHYKLIVNSFFSVFKFGTNQVTFDCFVKAMSIICRGAPTDKLPSLFSFFMMFF